MAKPHLRFNPFAAVHHVFLSQYVQLEDVPEHLVSRLGMFPRLFNLDHRAPQNATDQQREDGGKQRRQPELGLDQHDRQFSE